MVWSRLHPQLSLVVPAYPSQQSREWIRTGAATEHSYTNATTNAIYNDYLIRRYITTESNLQPNQTAIFKTTGGPSTPQASNFQTNQAAVSAIS